MILIPVLLSGFVTVGMIYVWSAWAILDTLIVTGIIDWVDTRLGIWLGNFCVGIACSTPLFGFFAYVCSEIAHLRIVLEEKMSTFSVADASVHQDSDREKIVSCINKW